MADERLLTVAEVAERLRLNPETVRRWLQTGKLHGFRAGGTKAGWRIPEGEMDRIMSQGNRTEGRATAP